MLKNKLTVVLPQQGEIDNVQYVMAVLSFFFVVFGGLTVGIVIGALSAFILKSTKDVRVIEPLIIMITVFNSIFSDDFI